MSRIVVKNLPKNITQNKLEEIFSSKGQITDLQLKYTKNGVFRQFAFIGFKTEDAAEAAKDYFHNTFIQTGKIKVEICHALSDADKLKPWSKHSKKETTNETEKEESKKPSKLSEDIPEELKNDAQFIEFLSVTSDRKSKPLWCDDAVQFENAGEGKGLQKDDESISGDDEKEHLSDSNEGNEDDPTAKRISDMEYLKTKMKTGSRDSSNKGKLSQKDKKAKALAEQFTVKIKKLPYSCKKKHLKSFFAPLKLSSIRIPPRVKGFAYVGFLSEKDMKKALNKNRGFIEGHRVEVAIYQNKNDQMVQVKDTKETEIPREEALEMLAETGRLFVRNLCFSVTEEDLKNVFTKYGPIAEIHIPTDFNSKKSQGFAFISFVFAEHAVTAFSELDGTILQGRLLHIIPAKPKKEIVLDTKDMTFKQKKDAKIKSLSHSSHNWNTLFLGLNAVADVLVEKYDVSKADLLSGDTKESVAVRMALGETQVVMETREFLVRNGVKLDSFSQAAGERSKNVIIAKNLPAKTSANQLLDVFSKHGTVQRVVMPPSGITALIEFQEASEAKTAFTRLAYSRFINKPLYLEWAPMEVFAGKPEKEKTENAKEEGISEGMEVDEIINSQKQEQQMESNKKGEEEDEDEEDDYFEDGATLFVKNLNFDTNEESLKKHFKGCGSIHSASISKKKDLKTGKLLSMGFGFVQYKLKSSAQTALQDLQMSELDGHALEIKFSNRATMPVAAIQRKKAKATKQMSSKICVRNIPFEITVKEVRNLFQEFGELKYVRLPKKADGSGSHRGFGFVDFVSKSCAKRAFEVLCHSTHLLGRRLVLEWANLDSEDVEELRKKTVKDFRSGGPQRAVKKARLHEDAMFAKPAEV